MPALAAENVAPLLKTGASMRVAEQVAPRFKPGDRIVVRNLNPATHTRLPRYLRGKHGVVEHDHGVFVFPDTNAHGKGSKAQHVYAVRFAARELWGERASARDSLMIDLWDDYVDPAVG